MIETDWIYGLVGGLMIGVAAAMMLLCLGRIAGVSGIVGGLLEARRAPSLVSIAFAAGLVGAPALATWALGAPLETNATSSLPLLLAGGLLVGFGTRVGAGCTSGHGVCGMSRFSIRSFAATATFIAFGVLSVTALRLLLGSV